MRGSGWSPLPAQLGPMTSCGTEKRKLPRSQRVEYLRVPDNVRGMRERWRERELMRAVRWLMLFAPFHFFFSCSFFFLQLVSGGDEMATMVSTA